jgi:hypothetical protein
MWLNQIEIAELTGRRQKASQIGVLRFMGIEHKIRPDGSVAVLKAHVEQSFGVRAPNQKKAKIAEPNWSAI